MTRNLITLERAIHLRLHLNTFITYSLLRQVHSLFQSDFSTKCHLGSFYNILLFPQGRPVDHWICICD